MKLRDQDLYEARPSGKHGLKILFLSQPFLYPLDACGKIRTAFSAMRSGEQARKLAVTGHLRAESLSVTIPSQQSL